MTDILGHLMAVVVHGGDIQDRDGGKLLLNITLQNTYPRLVTVLADGGYAGKLQEWIHRKSKTKIRLEIVKRTEKLGFHILPKRWIVERFFGWINWDRRLSKDYEHNPQTSVARLWMADSFLILKKLSAPSIVSG